MANEELDELWQSLTRPLDLGMYLSQNKLIDARKLRLLSAAVARSSWDTIPEGVCRDAIDATERHSIGTLSDAELQRCYNTVRNDLGSRTYGGNSIDDVKRRARFEIAEDATNSNHLLGIRLRIRGIHAYISKTCSHHAFLQPNYQGVLQR